MNCAPRSAQNPRLRIGQDPEITRWKFALRPSGPHLEPLVGRNTPSGSQIAIRVLHHATDRLTRPWRT
jgi:hypothetical protein